MSCIRCGRNEQIESHHIKARSEGGGDEPENKQGLCSPCHDYEHTKRNLLAFLEREKEGGQSDRIRMVERRLEVLERLNTPDIIRERGTYKTYWEDETTHHLPRLSRWKPRAKEQGVLVDLGRGK